MEGVVIVGSPPFTPFLGPPGNTTFCDLPETPCAIFNPFVPFVDPCNNRFLAGLPDLYLQAVSVGQWVVSDQFQTTDQFST